jgi:hypothetical protein
MSIEFLPFDTSRSSLTSRVRSAAAPKKPVSERRLAANRRNALRSSGPRTAAGKKRVARNALKHGVCAATVCLKSEDRPTFNLFLAEIERELQPRTVMQRILFDQIANSIWRLRRLPEAQAELFERELDLAADEEGGQTLSAAQVLAHRFSDDRSNGFALMQRYETSLRNGLLRMLRQYESLKKHRPTAPDDDDDPVVPREAAWSEARAAAQRQRFTDRSAALQRHEPPRDEREARIDRALWAGERADAERPRGTGAAPVSAAPGASDRQHGRGAHATGTEAARDAKRTHSKPATSREKASSQVDNAVSAKRARSPVAKQTQRTVQS